METEEKFGDITINNLVEMMGLASLEEYDTQGIQIYHSMWKHSPVLLSVSRNEKRVFFSCSLLPCRSSIRQWRCRLW